jgi:hypothetical protein
MKRIALAVALAALAGTAAAADKTYQATGPVLDVSADSITIQKGNEKWQIARTPETKTSAEPKKGDKVTVYYKMTATEIEAKAATGKADKKKK